MSTSEDNRSKSPSGIDAQNRKKHPCVLCQQRKVKCDRNDPCQNCTKARVECISASTMPPRKRKKRFPEAELLARLRKYEEHLKAYGADIDAINRSEGPVAPKETAEVKPNSHGAGCYPPHIIRSLSVRRSLRHVENNLWNGLNEEFRDAEEILQGSSDDEDFESPITKTYDAIGSDAGDLLFPSQPSETLTDLHPPPMHIFRLWQTFLDHVNPLIKIFHAPTVQQQVLDASADLAKVPKRMEVLMFGIYATAINSLDEPEVKTIFCEEKSILLNRYQSGCRQALLRAGFLRSSDMTILQGFILYLLSGLNFSIDPRALYCLTGITVRIAQRMGLNVDGTSYGLQPFEVEMRRRLWWQVILLDTRVGELSGAGPSLHMHMWTTKLPSNVNDSSLFLDMRDPPVEHPGVTEMLFVLQKCEIAQFVHHTRRACGPTDPKDGMIDAFEEMLEKKYLKYCDVQVPMHQISILMAKIGLCRLRMGPRHPHLMSVKGNDTSEEEKEKLFILSLTMLENHHEMMCAKNLSRFLWHIYTNFPFPAHVYLLCALRHRTTGELADRAWQQMSDSFDRRYNSDMKGRVKRGSQLQMALANLTLKAWDAREAALRMFQPCVPKPKFISGMREELASRKSPGSTEQSDTPQPPLGDAFGTQLEDAYQWLNQQPLSAQGLDQSVIPVSMPDSSSMDWSFWNGYLQVPMPAGFDNSTNPGFYQT